MKIKRFEAPSMSEALRVIKKEFGEDAVILSAKTMKKSSGLLANKRPQKVVVTAAIDDAPVAETRPADSPSADNGARNGSVAAERGNTAYSKFSFLKNYQPIP